MNNNNNNIYNITKTNSKPWFKFNIKYRQNWSYLNLNSEKFDYIQIWNLFNIYSIPVYKSININYTKLG